MKISFDIHGRRRHIGIIRGFVSSLKDAKILATAMSKARGVSLVGFRVDGSGTSYVFKRGVEYIVEAAYAEVTRLK